MSDEWEIPKVENITTFESIGHDVILCSGPNISTCILGLKYMVYYDKCIELTDAESEYIKLKVF